MSHFFKVVKVAVILSALIVLAPFLGAQAADRAEEPREGGIYRIPLLNNPSTLDPARVQDMYGVAVIQQIFDGLVQFSADLMPLPALAGNWRVQENGTVYHFTLRENARFHNGRPVTSRDVVFSLSRLFRVNPPPAILPYLMRIDGARDFAEGKADTIRGLRELDPRNIQIRLESPYVPFLIALGMYQAKILPAEEVQKGEDAFGKHPVGSGPFQFLTWQENDSIQIRRFEGYYQGHPFLDGIDYMIFPGGRVDAALASLREGKLEELPVYGVVRSELQDQTSLQWAHRPSLSLLFYGFNCSHPVLKDSHLRRSLSHAIDRSRLVSQVYGGQFEAAQSILPPGMPGYRPRKEGTLPLAPGDKGGKGEGQEQSPNKSVTIEIVSNSQSPLAQAELNLIGKFWAPLGFRVETKFIPDWSKFEQYIQSDAVQVYRYAWFADLPDPDSFLYPLFSNRSPVNFMHYENGRVDEMLATARTIIDPLKRAELYRSIEDIILNDSPLVPLFYLSVDCVYRSEVRGIEMNPLGAHTMSYHHVWLAK